MSPDSRITALQELIRDVHDFPKPGIVFKDITPLLAHSEAYESCISMLSELTKDMGAEIIAGPEARGFLFGAPLALKTGVGFAPIRKKGKLPYRTIEENYQLEYGIDTIAVHEDAFRPGQRVLLVDDVLATGGTIAACRSLVEKTGAEVVGAAFLMELEFLSGRKRLPGIPIEHLIAY